MGGQFFLNGKADGWGEVDDRESIQAIAAAMELGINFFDTSDAYGTGHSERVIGQAIQGKRDKVIIATKFGFTINEGKKEITGTDISPEYIKKACYDSLKRLSTDYIDLYQLHCGAANDQLLEVLSTLDELKQSGVIRSYGWSTQNPLEVKSCIHKKDFTAVQHEMNLFNPSAELVELCKENNLASIIRSPLAMGLLTGKYDKEHQMSKNDFFIYYS
ncbi:MAG: aldo/keto reductase, partial [Spirochaetes bacterium]|nr:aldo/keto reductase [Spirochaetota bacterium]